MRLRLGTRVDPDAPLNRKQVFIDRKDAVTHVTLLGKSGSGKTELLKNWIISCLIFRIAVILVEPIGSLSKSVYAASKGTAIYNSLKHPVPINPLLLPFDPDTVASICKEGMNQVITLTTKSANKETTAKMGVHFINGIKESLAGGNPSLIDVRDRIAARKGDAETRDGLIARLDFILSDARMRHILCGPGTLDVARLTAEGKTFIMDCSTMTKEAMIFTGNIITQAVQSHLLFADHSKLKPLMLALDESQNFVSPPWSDLLKMGRHIQLCCVLSSQELIFFPEELRRVMLHVGNLVTFRLGAKEARDIAAELRIPVEALQFEEKYHLHFLTPSERGRARAPRPAVMRPFPLPTYSIAPVTSSPAAPAAPQSMPQIHWFPIQPLPPPATSTPEAAPVEAH